MKKRLWKDNKVYVAMLDEVPIDIPFEFTHLKCRCLFRMISSVAYECIYACPSHHAKWYGRKFPEASKAGDTDSVCVTIRKSRRFSDILNNRLEG